MKNLYSIPNIAEKEKTPIVQKLLLQMESMLKIIQEKSETIQLYAEIIQQLKDEIARLKNQKPKPKIKPSKLGKKGNKSKDDKDESTNDNEDKSEDGDEDKSINDPETKRPGSEKRKGTVSSRKRKKEAFLQWDRFCHFYCSALYFPAEIMLTKSLYAPGTPAGNSLKNVNPV